MEREKVNEKDNSGGEYKRNITIVVVRISEFQ